jgi:putative lipoic acid-binding regulatory protein
MITGMNVGERLEFPCAYPIKVLMRTAAGLRESVDAAIDRHAGAPVAAAAQARQSARGNFSGVTYTIQARDAQHIAELFAELRDIPGVLMVL